MTFRDSSCLLPEIVSRLDEEDAFVKTGAISFQGRSAWQFVAETEVVLDRPGRKRTATGRVQVPGSPLKLRWVIAGSATTKIDGWRNGCC